MISPSGRTTSKPSTRSMLRPYRVLPNALTGKIAEEATVGPGPYSLVGSMSPTLNSSCASLKKLVPAPAITLRLRLSMAISLMGLRSSRMPPFMGPPKPPCPTGPFGVTGTS